jgi:DNA polymerase-3 subunit alpha
MESTIKIKDLVSAAARNGMKAVALTDKYVMSGAVEFYKEATDKNIKPIIGCEICVMNNQILSHLVILIKNTISFIHLKKIKSRTRKDSLRNNLLREVKSAWEI